MKKILIVSIILLMIAVSCFGIIRNINLPNDTALLAKITSSNMIANAMKDAASITRAKADLALTAGAPLIIQMVQDSFSFDGVVKQEIKNEQGVVIDTLYFYKLVKPYKEVIKIQISLSELNAKIADLQAQKTALIAAQNKVIADETAKANGIATAIVDDGSSD